MDPMMDMSDIVESFSDPYTVIRYAPGTHDSNGLGVQGSTTSIQIFASVQPLSGRDLLRLPEGRENEERIKIYTATQLFTEGINQGADVLLIDPDSGFPASFPLDFDADAYEVETVEPWGRNGKYWKAIAKATRRVNG